MRASRILAVLAAATALAFALGVAFGTMPLSLSRALVDPSSKDRLYLVVRLPHVTLAALAGAGLALVGAAFQAVLRNPLAEPFVLGVSGGAALGATCALLFLVGTTFVGASAIPLAALAGGLAATALVYVLAGSGARGRRASLDGSLSTNILLAGVVVNALASAVITLIKTLVTASKAQEVLFWLAGFISDERSTTEIAAVSVYVGAGVAMLLRDAGRLNLLALGDEAAGHLGVDVRALERRVFLACSLVVGAIVSVSGMIGFVGLIVPHVLRRLLGPDNRVLLPASLLGGATTLVLCDLASRFLFRWTYRDLPVGVVTALVGGPLFLALLRRR